MIFKHGNLNQAMEELQAVRKGETPERDRKAGKESQAEQWKRELNEDREEKPNALAVFLAALIVVIPPLLVAAGLMLLALWLFLGRF